ncbi:IspD/TarI family cytidylyltransferase [Amycolatopsis antarctica]|uniref:IspD/TarI family cytidylyltransferase n=1 Tax=Amycolatopsis antarctica TaxID=1854586 RepID=UPI001F0A1D93|nr:IspD/TarI family cytidylyltransferase [Amycolatopsis antarctica]
MSEPQVRAAAVVLASGAGTRVGSATNKVYLPLAGRPLLHWSLDAFAGLPGIAAVVLVARPQDQDLAETAASAAGAELVHGGSSRQESELHALRHLAGRIRTGEIDTVLIHDGARPLVGPELIAEVLRTVAEHGGAVPGLLADDVEAASADGTALAPTPPGRMVKAQTPQGFRAAELLAVYERAAAEGFTGTDTASCVERFSDLPVHWVPGDQRNLKITYPHDLVVAEGLLAAGG